MLKLNSLNWGVLAQHRNMWFVGHHSDLRWRHQESWQQFSYNLQRNCLSDKGNPTIHLIYNGVTPKIYFLRWPLYSWMFSWTLHPRVVKFGELRQKNLHLPNIIVNLLLGQLLTMHLKYDFTVMGNIITHEGRLVASCPPIKANQADNSKITKKIKKFRVQRYG